MNYFKNTDSNDTAHGVLSKRVKYLKESEGGTSYMCEFIEKFREEGRNEGLSEGLNRGITQGRQLSKISTIRKMYIKNMNFNQISDVLDDDNEVKIIYDIIVNAPDKDDEWVYNRLVEAEK